MLRKISQIWSATPTQDGAGVKIQRSIAGTHPHALFDPFLMLDELHSDQTEDYIAGFPEHPHRGFETVTYMLKGSMRHRDHMGNEGVIHSGDVQWMTAGRGVIHSEMPEQTSGEFHGFQLWVNLPSAEKMQSAQYRAVLASEIPEIPLPLGGTVRLIAGDFHSQTATKMSVKAALSGISTEPVLWDVVLAANEQIHLALPQETLLVYVVSGELSVSEAACEGEARHSLIESSHLARLSEGDEVLLTASRSARCLILGGEPIREPVVSYGPFVMNSRKEINQAIEDYRLGQLVSSF